MKDESAVWPTWPGEKAVLQRLFDKSLGHIRQQGGPCYDVNPRQGHVCLYKGPNGRGCAAAPFIISYSKEMEGTSFMTLVQLKQFGGKLDPEAASHPYFVDDLQRAHDSSVDFLSSNPDADFMDVYERRMREVAKIHRLSYAPPVPQTDAKDKDSLQG
jgi:hypothetical protein